MKKASRNRLLGLLTILLGCGAGLATVEAVLRLRPDLLPESYLEQLPFRGAELFRPGILEATPVEAVPVPYLASPVYGKPALHVTPFPPKLQEMGLAPPGPNSNLPVIGDVTVRIDRDGFGNPEVLDRADVLLVGDSFTFAAAIVDPPGLQTRLHETTGLAVYNLGVPAIGTLRELWLLKHVGLAKKPRAVIWFFFPANDLGDTERLRAHQARGARSYADIMERPMPRGPRVADLLRSLAVGGTPEKPAQPPVPGVALHGAGGPVDVWFYPPYLRNLTLSREQWQQHSQWEFVQQLLLEARRASNEAGAEFLLVYVPSKPEIYLPFVEPNEDRIRAMAAFGLDEPGRRELPLDFLAVALRNRTALESMVSEFCAASDIPFYSFSAALTEQVRRGEIGYAPADSHWVPAGQLTGLEGITGWLRDAGVIPALPGGGAGPTSSFVP